MLTANHHVPDFIARRRWWVLPLLAWAAVIGVSLASHFKELEAHSREVAVAGARDMFRMVVLIRAWNAEHGGVYLPVSDKVQPNPYLEHPRRDLVTRDGRALTMVNPAFMTRLLSELAKAGDGATFHITSLKPIRPGNEADPWEREALRIFESGVGEAIEIVPAGSGGGRQLRYMAPLFVTPACLPCHAKQGYREGDIRGGISVTSSYAAIDEAVSHGKAQSTFKHLAIFLLGAMAGFILLELLRRRWFKLAFSIAELKAARADLDQSNQALRQARDVAEAANIAKSEFLANMSHELRTPLNAIAGFGFLLKGKLSDPQQQGHLGQILRASDRLLEMISQLLSLAEADTGRLKQVLERFEVSQLADEAYARLQADAAEKGLGSRLEIDRNAMPCWLYGDRSHIGDVVDHYIANAVKFSERGDITLSVACRPAEDGRTRLHIEVRDQGIGIAADQLPGLFALFHQVDGSSTRRYGGNGIGLILCKRLAELMGGEVGVSSTLGEGSCFWLDVSLAARL